MRFGKKWSVGSLWGIDQGSARSKEFCQNATDRLLIQMDDDFANRKFRDLICILARPYGKYLENVEDIRNAFDTDTAAGEQLDLIGKLIGLPRHSFTDDRYRTFLRIQRDLISSQGDAGEVNNILRICRTFVGPGPSIQIINLTPYSFLLSIPSLTSSTEFDLLISFLCIALYAGVLGQVITSLGPNSLWNSDQVTITEGAVWCSAHPGVSIPDCAVWGMVTTIGDCNAN